MSNAPTPDERCPRCDELVDEHTVAELRRCMSDLHAHDLPYEALPETGEQELAVITAGSVVVKAGTHRSVVAGVQPVLVFEFTSPEGPVPPIALLLDDSHMRSVRQLVSAAVDGALRAARKQRGR